MAQTGLSSGVADLVSALTGGGAAIQQRAKTAEEMRMMQVQQERALLDERVQKAIGATNQNRYQSEYLGAAPSREDFAAVGGFGADHLASRRAFGVDQQNEARGLAAEIAKIAPMGPDRQNALIGVAGDKLLAPSNVQVDAQAGADIDRILAAAGASNASAALNQAQLPFVGALAQGEVDLNAAQLANTLQSGRLAGAKAGLPGTAGGAVKAKADVFASSAMSALDQLDVLDAEGIGGPIAGRITPAWGPGGQKIEQYDTLASALRADLQRLQRVPGVGAQSDRELAELIKASQSVGQNPETRQVISALIRRKLTELGARNWDASDGAAPLGGEPPSAEDSRDIDGKRYTKVNGRWMEE